VDRNVPSHVTYWTGIWEPTREALSKEVHTLRHALAPGAPVVSISQGQASSWLPHDNVIKLFGNRWYTFRALAAVLEPRGAFSHAFGEVNAWHLLRALGRRPILFTVAIDGPGLQPELYAKVSRFVAESQSIADSLVGAGAPASRIEIVYPGVDLTRYAPSVCPAKRFTVLFASSPGSPADLPRRGIPLLVEAARYAPDVDVVLLWRRWGQLEGCMAALQALQPPPNVQVKVGDVSDMSQAFGAVHATVFAPVEGHGKAAPNSVLEGLACGRPTVVSRNCGIASLVERHGAGVVLEKHSPHALADAWREVCRQYSSAAIAARGLAEQCFSRDEFVAAYSRFYADLSS
jgi:glycosyltransferase involved in cell wall biosynthesis